MKFTALIFLVALTLSAAADQITGMWKTVMVDPPPGGKNLPLIPYEPTFEFKVDGTRLTGTAHMPQWPGDAPISNGSVDGNRIKFTLIHEQSYTSGLTGTHYPEFKCEGTIRGKELELTMTGVDAERRYGMKGIKVSQ